MRDLTPQVSPFSFISIINAQTEAFLHSEKIQMEEYLIYFLSSFRSHQVSTHRLTSLIIISQRFDYYVISTSRKASIEIQSCCSTETNPGACNYICERPGVWGCFSWRLLLCGESTLDWTSCSGACVFFSRCHSRLWPSLRRDAQESSTTTADCISAFFPPPARSSTNLGVGTRIDHDPISSSPAVWGQFQGSWDVGTAAVPVRVPRRFSDAPSFWQVYTIKLQWVCPLRALSCWFMAPLRLWKDTLLVKTLRERDFVANWHNNFDYYSWL